MKPSLAHELEQLKKDMRNRSPKPSKRLKASLASFRYKEIMASLPGSVRRGLERGHL